jgi:hypothetical protein
MSLKAYAQECNYVHPPAPPQSSQFEQPPSGHHFEGPAIRQVSVQCWYAEPKAPDKCIGGVHGFQKVTRTITTEKPDRLDVSFHQKSIASFSGGGAKSDLKVDDIPPGIFVSFIGHPIYRVTKIEYPSSEPPSLAGPGEDGVKVSADFNHEPSNGECYFYAAVWTAEK